MIVTSPGIVLSRRPFGESDRLAMVYTEELGRVQLRFVGVLKPRAKLRAFSEPFTCADFRMFVKTASEYGKCIGGGLRTVYPAVRADLGKTLRAFYYCELLERLTPYRHPNPLKFRLLDEALTQLGLIGASTSSARSASPIASTGSARTAGEWLDVAYALRLMRLAGIGAPEPSAGDKELWSILHDAPLESIPLLPAEPEALSRARRQVERHLGALLDWPLKSTAFTIPYGETVLSAAR